MCHKLIRPLHALHEAVREGETCMQESELPSRPNSTHSWLLESVLKRGMSTEIVDRHLHHLLWTSSVVCEQILRYAPIDDIGLVPAEQITRDLCEIWAHVDASDDILEAQSMLNRIIAEEEGETSLLANFILQKLVSTEHMNCITDSADLPPFLWVDPQDLRRNPEILGEGAHTKIQEAIWLGGRFAVKDIFHVENNVQLEREVTIQARLHHPNVLPLVCCSRNPSRRKFSLVMQLMRQDLRLLILQTMQRAKMETPFSLVHAVDLMLQIAQGMEYLHGDDLRIIHRDLKSFNILVCFSSSAGASSSYAKDAIPHVQLKVSDFGVSKAKFTSSRYTTGSVGTTAWMAPEVYEEEGNERYTNKADVYSFGMVCYEILTGKLPFEGMTQVRKRVLSGERPRMPLNCPRALSSYIERCWHADPKERPSFTQICRMLRFFKACILLQDYDDDDDNAVEYSEWLLHPLSTSTCGLIDDRLRNLVVEQFDGVIQPSLVAIPLEMYCCRVVLTKSRDEIGVADPISHSRRDAGIHPVAEHQRSALESKDLKQPAKDGRFNKTFKWLTKLSWMRGLIQHGNSGALTPWQEDLQHALCNMTREFTERELRKATKNFSSSIGSSKFYLGQLVDGQRIAVRKGGTFGRGSKLQGVLVAIQHPHPNIVPLLGWCRQGDNLNLVYKYMPNGDLQKHIFSEDRNYVFGWQERYRVVCEVAEALNYVHHMGIVHLNIKPSSILLDSEWNAFLGNWDLSTLIAEDDDGIAGTVGYLAPEYISTGKCSPAVDIYSFGVTVLEIATGRKIMPQWNSEDTRSKIYMLKWVWRLYQEEELMQAADVRLAGIFDEAEMRRLLLLSLSCVNSEPQARPTMDKVLRILSKASDSSPPTPRGSPPTPSNYCASDESLDVWPSPTPSYWASDQSL